MNDKVGELIDWAGARLLIDVAVGCLLVIATSLNRIADALDRAHPPILEISEMDREAE